MPVTINSIPNLLNGVSSQAAELRLTTQGALQINGYSTLTKGLSKRPPSLHKKNLGTITGIDNANIHFINRDQTERYIVSITDGDLRVWDLAGTEKTVTFGDAANLKTSVNALNVVGNGTAYQVFLHNSATNLSVITTGFGVGTILLQESTTGLWAGEETTKATITTNTTTVVTGISGRYYRCRLSARTSGTMTAKLSWKSSEYLHHATPRSGFAVTTIADYTFIANRDTVVAMDTTAVSPAPTNEALISVFAGNYGKDYAVTLNGTKIVTVGSPDGTSLDNAPWIDTTVIARLLLKGFQASWAWQGGGAGGPGVGTVLLNTDVPTGDGGGTKYAPSLPGAAQFGQGCGAFGFNAIGGKATAPWTVTRYVNSLHVQNSSADFSIEVSDGFNGSAMKVMKNQTQRFSNLPFVAPDGFVVEVTGESSNTFDNYWVKYVKGTNDGEGVWKETVAPSTNLALDAATMPYILVRNVDGTFTLSKATWSQRNCGNEERAPQPSFVGEKIKDIFLHRNRLGVVAGENVILSRSGSFFNFWRQTLTAVLDTDPIDVGSSYNKVATYQYAVPFNQDLFMMADGAQFRLTGGDLLTPKTAAAKLHSEFALDANCRPVSGGTLMYWAGTDQDRSVIRELWIDETNVPQVPLEANNHCPDFVPKNIHKLVVSPDTNMLGALTSEKPQRLYIYKYFWQGREKPQAAWSYWDFGADILGAGFIETTLYLVVKNGTDARILAVPCQVDYVDTGMTFPILLEERVLLSGGSYSAGLNRTSYTMPYTVPSTIEAWSGYAAAGEIKPGHRLEIDSYTGTTLRLEGDTTLETVYAGRPYEFRYRFSDLYARRDKGTGSAAPITEGRTQILRMWVTYDGTGFFQIEVTPENRAKYTYDDNVGAFALDDPLFTTEDVNLEDGKVSFPVKCENRKVLIDLVNSQALPCRFLSAEYAALWNPKARRI